MKFLLAALNAKYIHSNPAIYSLRAYAAAKSPEAEREVELAEYTINQKPEDILADLYGRKPDVVGFSCYIWNWRMVRKLVRELHKILPDLPIWLGGPEVSFRAEEIAREEGAVTGIMTGEGEETFSQVLEYYREKENGAGRKIQMQIAAFWPGAAETSGLHSIAGLVFRDSVSGEIVKTGARMLTDLNAIPFFYRDMTDFENRIVYYESSRGCPFNCSYCLSSVDKTLRLRDLELVKKELQFFLDRKVEQVKFIDRTFNCNHRHAQEIWNYILEHDNGVTNFHFEIAADLLDGAELSLLSKMRPGLVQLEIGVQSINPRTLRAVRRYANLERLRHTVVRIHAEHNIHVHLDLIAGLPEEDMASFARSFDAVYTMRPQQLQLGFLKLLKGSYLEETADVWGIVAQSEPPYEVLYTKWLSYDDIIRLKRVEEMVELYYNSGQFTRVLPLLELHFKSPFALFSALADYYEKKGYRRNSPSREYRYQVLLDFAEQADPTHAQLYRELLVYDLYLRENVKSRPAFAGEGTDAGKLAARFAHGEKLPRSQFHIELFTWPVDRQAWELAELFDRCSREGKVPEEKTAIFFDYRQRSPLDYNALSGRIAPEENKREESK